jgi:hypothetical protein
MANDQSNQSGEYVVRLLTISVICGLALTTSAIAASPYAGWQDREIKAISAERIDALRSGKGAGYALSAELNGYPGPRHVLDLADELELSSDQRQVTERLFESMRAETIPLGEALIEAEHLLEALFREGRADEETIAALTAEIGAHEGRLRAAHLKYHVEMTKLMDVVQRDTYNRLRGYGEAPEVGHVGSSGHVGHGD